MARNKRARVEGDGVEGRAGVTWRSPKYVVEMRLSKKVAEKMKLQFGSYDTMDEAMVARDYGAYVRDSTGKENRASVGGFRDPDVHPSIFNFEESLAVFESLKALKGSGSRAQARCDEFKSLLESQTTEACIKFCEAAREDIKAAIELFRSRHPQTFLRPPRWNRLPNAAEPVDASPPSSSEVRVPPTPGREVGASMGEGALSLEVRITGKGSPAQTLLLKDWPFLTAEEISMIAKPLIDRIEQELTDKMISKCFEELGPPSSSEVRVPPTPGPEVGASMGEGSTSFIDALSLQLQTLQLMNWHCPTAAGETLRIIKAGLDRIKQELFYKWFEELGPCTIEPESIAALE